MARPASAGGPGDGTSPGAPPRRTSGVLLHPTALPGPYGSGDLGAGARHFVDWLATGGQTLWQVLPLGPTGPGDSPYMSPSAFAGNPLLVDLAALRDAGWLSDAEALPPDFGSPHRIDFPAVRDFRLDRLRRAARRFLAAGPRDADFASFRAAEMHWLADDALFAALAGRHGDDPRAWPARLRRREPAALAAARTDLAGAIAEHEFIQWCFDRQWRALRAYARERGVTLVGDLPIYVAAQGVDAWAHPGLFDLDADGAPNAVAGVPPDYFSATGQHWGNPLYRWDAHAADGFRWWIARVRRALAHCDRLRIDHFRGFAAGWAIPAGETTAVAGHWRPGPGAALFDALRAALGSLPLIAEDLGLITADVHALRRRVGLPGMRVLQFAFDGKPLNPYLPHMHAADAVVFTGTHDNDTTRGWWDGLDDTTRQRVAGYFGHGVGEFGAEPHWHLIRAAFASVAGDCIVPMQDVLGLGSAARFNRPGAAEGCWGWRFTWDPVGPAPADRLREMAARYGRGPIAGDGAAVPDL